MANLYDARGVTRVEPSRLFAAQPGREPARYGDLDASSSGYANALCLVLERQSADYVLGRIGAGALEQDTADLVARRDLDARLRAKGLPQGGGPHPVDAPHSPRGPFERAMQVAEFGYIAGSRPAQMSIAENYVGLPI